MIGWSCLLMSTALAMAPVEIRSAGSCPSSGEVAQRLAELLPATAAARPTDVAQLGAMEPGGGGLILTLRRADGTLLARRSLTGSRDGAPRGSGDGGATCTDLAAAAALIIATWESDVHPEFKLDVPRRPRLDGRADRISQHRSQDIAPARDVALARAHGGDQSEHDPAPVPRLATPAELIPPPFLPVLPVLPDPGRSAGLEHGAEARRVPAQPPRATRLRSSASVAAGSIALSREVASADLPPPVLPPPIAPTGPRPRPRPAPVTLVAAPSPGDVRSPPLMGSVVDVGVAAIGALSPSDQGIAGGATLAGGWTGVRHWGAHLALLATTERTTSLAAGQVNWRRVTLTLGAQRRWEFRGGRLTLDIRADGAAALLTMRGTGFASNDSDRAVDPGGGGAVRLAVGRGRWRPWLEVSTVAWLLRRLAYESPDNGALVLPRVETMLALGFSYWNSL